jgi:hypothetical protein
VLVHVYRCERVINFFPSLLLLLLLLDAGPATCHQTTPA